MEKVVLATLLATGLIFGLITWILSARRKRRFRQYSESPRLRLETLSRSSSVPKSSAGQLRDVEPVSIVDNDAALTAVYPAVVAPTVVNSMLVFAHRIGEFTDEFGDLRDPVALIEAEVRREFPPERSIQSFTSPTSPRMRLGVDLTLSVRISGAEVWPSTVTQRLSEPVQSTRFRFRFSTAPVTPHVTGEVVALVGPIIVAVVPLSLDVSLAVAQRHAPTKSDSGRVYQRIFASYSRKDSEIVEQIERSVETLGARYLRDVRDLRSGENWQPRLRELIEQCDAGDSRKRAVKV